ncbi:PRC-barrel domain-containing protein [Halalkalibaculum sp. DA3122]|uniref:PRC-barrel domain-containing protein n=1 Tax=unclassified Halalkalibaculum TaxID=2964617 RepID=UPI003754906C
MGRKVKNRDGEDVGVIQNIMIDPGDGMILYIMLCYADFVGKMHRHFAIPNSLMRLKNNQENGIFFEIEEQKLSSVERLSDITGTTHTFTKYQRVYEVDQDAPWFSEFHLYT